VLDLCAGGAELHFVSSLSVFRDHHPGSLPEQTPLPAVPPDRGGYAQTKWAAEQLVWSFVARGGRAHVHRLALLVGPTQNDGYVGALVRGCRQLGAVPTVDFALPVIRRDVAASAIAASVGTPPRTWHLQEMVCPTIRQLAAAAGVTQTLSPDRWLHQLEMAVARDAAHPLAPYIEFIRASRSQGALDPVGTRSSQLDGRQSWRLLAELGVEPADDLGALIKEVA